MVLVPVGEHGVTISINGTQRVSDLIRDDTNYNLSESFNTQVYVNGSRRVNTTQNSDDTYNITESLGSTIKVNGSTEGSFSQTSNSTYDIPVTQLNNVSWYQAGYASGEDATNSPTTQKEEIATISSDRIVYGWIHNYESYYSPQCKLQYSSGDGNWDTWLNASGEADYHIYRSDTRRFSSGTIFRLYQSDNGRYKGEAKIELTNNGEYQDKGGNWHPKPDLNIGNVSQS
jgi:hypothetical protein